MQQVSHSVEPQLPRLLTIEEVATITKVSTSHLYALINEGVLPAFSLVGPSAIRLEDLDSFALTATDL